MTDTTYITIAITTLKNQDTLQNGVWDFFHGTFLLILKIRLALYSLKLDNLESGILYAS